MFEFRLGEMRNRFGAVHQIAPELIDIGGAGKTSGHTDDGDAIEIRSGG